MENDKDVEVDKMLSEAGFDVVDLSEEEKRQLLNAVKQSVQDSEPFGQSTIRDTQVDKMATVKEEKEVLKSLLSGDLFGKLENDSNNSNLGNIGLGEKEITKQYFGRGGNYANALIGSTPTKAGPSRIEKSAPGSAVPARNNEPNTNSTYHTNLSSLTDSLWLDSKNHKENNGVLRRCSPPRVKEEVKSEEADNSGGTDNTNTLPEESKGRESPDIIEVVPLMPLLFNKRISTSFFPENALPPLSLPRDEWLNKVNRYFYIKKTAKIAAEGRHSKWVTLSERNINLSSLENALARASPKHNKDDNFSENAENSPKARTSPESIIDNVRESSPEVAVVENSPKRDVVNSEARDNVASALPDSSKRFEKNESGPNSPLGRSVDDSGMGDSDQTRKRISKNKGRRGRGGLKQGSSSNEDNSNGAQNSARSAKNNDGEYILSNSEFPRIGSSSCPDDNVGETRNCPVCGGWFGNDVIDEHAWGCGRDTEEEGQVVEDSKNVITVIKQVKNSPNDDERLVFYEKTASKFNRKSDDDDNDGDDDCVKEKPPRKFSRKRDKDDDDEDFVIKRPRSKARKRSQVMSDDDESPLKNPRK